MENFYLASYELVEMSDKEMVEIDGGHHDPKEGESSTHFFELQTVCY